MRLGLLGLIREAFPELDDSGIGVVDVGSREGLHTMFDEIAPLVDAVGFEPDPDECHRLSQKVGAMKQYRSLAFLPFGLGSEDGLRTLRLCRSRGTSSLSPPNRAFLNRFPEPERFDVEAELSIPVRTLDGLAADPVRHLPTRIDFVKVDTQGSELDVLRGARKTLGEQVVAVEVEVEFNPLYESAALFRDVDAYLAGCGFTLFKLRRLEWVRQPFAARPERSAGQVVFGDALYLRDPVDPRTCWVPHDRHQAESLVLLALLYDLHDFAWEVAGVPALAGLIDMAGVHRYIGERCRRLGPRWTRWRTFREWGGLVRAAARGFRSYAPTWARGDDGFYSRITIR